MKKRALMALPNLTATDEMKKIATSDLPRKEKTDYGYVREVCEYYTYLRCIKQDGILKVAFFFPEHLRLDGSNPAYEVYLDKEKRQFITYNSLIQKWCESKLDRLDWKRQYWYTKAYWMSMVQVYNYVRRQMPSFRRNSHEVLRTWEDYLSMAKKLHMDVYDEIVYRTRKLRRRHDDLVLKCQEKDIELQAEEMEEKFPHVNAICQEIKTKYEYADADYMVVVPSGILDIITEGRALHHCVGSSDRYWDRIERRESFVMFLRKTDDPFHAYYTLEVEPDGTVRQKRTEYDRQKKDIEQATEFLQKWQRVVTARLTESDKALAAESRVLREKEFIQLKKDRVIIHTGHLAGKLLVDVLMADLMENTDSIQSPALAAAA